MPNQLKSAAGDNRRELSKIRTFGLFSISFLLNYMFTICNMDGWLQVLKESGLMEEREYETYLSLFSNMSNFM